MTAPTILVAGTWGRKQPAGWWSWGSEFRQYLTARGVPLLGRDANSIFSWTTNDDGVDGDNADWDESGKAPLWYAHAMLPPSPKELFDKPVSVIAHSHGGNVLAYAAWHGLEIDTAITLATPVRADMDDQYSALAAHSREWIHIYTDERIGIHWQILGALGLHTLFKPVRREMRFASENLYVPGHAHADLTDADLWRSQRWHGLLVEDKA